MRECDFYDLMDKVENFENFTGTYFPTVEELEAHKVDKDLPRYLPLLMYFANDPYGEGALGDPEEEKEYKRTVNYLKSLISNIKLD